MAKNSCLNLSSIFCFFFSLLFILINPSHQCKPSCEGTPTSQPIQNPRLVKAYKALQAWKHAIFSDPQGITSNWYGKNVCNYNGVFCANAPDDPQITTVAGIDLNGGDVAGSLPDELGLLTDIALIHLNSNRFNGTIPRSFTNFHLLYELDVSNNLLSGSFPSVVLSISSLKYLDLRFNQFEGPVPPPLFNLELDAIFLNNNNFNSSLPKNICNTPVSVLVLANNKFTGSLPCSLSNKVSTLEEIILINMGLSGCLPPKFGGLTNLTVFDVSFNDLVGPLPEVAEEMKDLEILNVAQNRLSGEIPASICSSPKLTYFNHSYNYIVGEPPCCTKLRGKDSTQNCISGRPSQRPKQECDAALIQPVICEGFAFSSVAPSPSPAVAPSMLSPVYML